MLLTGRGIAESDEVPPRAWFNFQTGPDSLPFRLDGRAPTSTSTSGGEGGPTYRHQYSRLRSELRAVETLDDGHEVLIRNAAGYEELWQKTRWVLGMRHKRYG